jgi:hypothetical protein
MGVGQILGGNTLKKNRMMARVGFALAVMSALLVTNSGAASAADHQMVLRNSAGTVVVKATWTDLTDNLCVITYAGYSGEVAISSYYGLSEPDRAIRSAGSYAGAGWVCTGNLSIREDAYYNMQIRWENANRNLFFSGKEQFYT